MACSTLRYFEVFAQSGKWSYSLQFKKYTDQQMQAMSDTALYVTNVPVDFQPREIEEVFNKYGKIICCEPHVDA